MVPGEVIVPPAGTHLLVGPDDRVHLIPTGLIPPARPSADLLLSTLAAGDYGPPLPLDEIAAVLIKLLDDQTTRVS